MNRDILFKAKRKDNNEWVYGHYMQDGLGNHYIIEIKKQEEKDYYFGKTYRYIEVILETVCQYTGLKDKNEVKVFENDIVKAINTFGCADEDVEGQVYFDMFNGMELKVSECEDVHFDYLDELEVIGNIFDK